MSTAPGGPSRTRGDRRVVRPVGLALVVIGLALPLLLLDWIAVRDWIGYGGRVEYLGIEVRLPRASWFPGPELLLPPQACPECRAGRAETCANRVGALLLDGGPGAIDARPGTFRLSCSPDLDHRLSSAADQLVCSELIIGSIVVTPDRFDCAVDRED